MGFENIAVVRVPVEFNAAAELLEVRGGESNAGVDRGFRVGGRFGLNQFAGEIEEGALFAARPGQQGAHGKSGFSGGWHAGSLAPRWQSAADGRLPDSTPLTTVFGPDQGGWPEWPLWCTLWQIYHSTGFAHAV
jgi:hypothetical protein